MSILVDSETRVLCQGITGSQASFYTERAISFGTRMVAGVRPGKGGSTHLGLPVYDDVLTARSDTDANASVIFVPKDRAADAILESIDAEIPLIICITEHIPVLDMARVRERLDGSESRLLGPNTPGIITPEECRIGIMPRQIFRRGRAGIISRSSTLTYEAVWQTTDAGLGQSTCVGIGGDPLHGLGFVDCLQMFGSDPEDRTRGAGGGNRRHRGGTRGGVPGFPRIWQARACIHCRRACANRNPHGPCQRHHPVRQRHGGDEKSDPGRCRGACRRQPGGDRCHREIPDYLI